MDIQVDMFREKDRITIVKVWWSAITKDNMPKCPMYRNAHLRTTNQMYDQLNGKSVVSEGGNN